MIRVVFNQKGGVGKTSITCNLAAALAKLGKRVLVVDLDAQANSTHYLLGEKNQDPTIADFFESTLNFKLFQFNVLSAVHGTEYRDLFVLPSSPALADLQTKLESKYKIFKLAQALEEVRKERDIDEILIDTPPALNFYSMSALIAADRVLIPFDCDAFSADAVATVIDIVEEVADDHRLDLKVEGVVINQFQANAKLPSETIDALVSQGLKVISPFLSPSIVMRESHAAAKPLVFFRPKHKLTQEFVELATKLTSARKKKKTARKAKQSRPSAEA